MVVVVWFLCPSINWSTRTISLNHQQSSITNFNFTIFCTYRSKSHFKIIFLFNVLHMRMHANEIFVWNLKFNKTKCQFYDVIIFYVSRSLSRPIPSWPTIWRSRSTTVRTKCRAISTISKSISKQQTNVSTLWPWRRSVSYKSNWNILKHVSHNNKLIF